MRNSKSLVGPFICRSCRRVVAEKTTHCPHCGTADALNAVISCEEWRERGDRLILCDEAKRLRNVSAKVLAEYDRLGKLHPVHVAFSNVLTRAYDRKELAGFPRYTRDATNNEPSYLVPGVITQLEFRARYGYASRRTPCGRCQGFHSRGASRACANGHDSGTHYQILRADGTCASKEPSAKGAWEAAYSHEQQRFAPILIARDALAEGRAADAEKIAAQLTPDLADPLRREIADYLADQLGKKPTA